MNGGIDVVWGCVNVSLPILSVLVALLSLARVLHY